MDNLSLLRPTQPDQPFLLAADIDGTLLGDPIGEDWLKAFIGAHAPALRLAYVTGRYRFTVMELIEKGRLPKPDYICSDVGTDLFDLNDPQNILGQKYWSQVAADWDLEAIYACGVGPGVWLQDFGADQPPYQAGFFWDGNPETLEAFYARMGDNPHYSIYPSYGEYIDVLPAPLGKGKVVHFLQRELGVEESRVVVAGDAGNDRQMFETGFKGILPSNALEELREIACQPWHYHSPLPMARGVLDGLRYFGFIKIKDKDLR